MKYLILTVSALFLVGCSTQQEATFKAPVKQKTESEKKINSIEAKIGSHNAASLKTATEYEDKTAEALMEIEMEGRK